MGQLNVGVEQVAKEAQISGKASETHDSKESPHVLSCDANIPSAAKAVPFQNDQSRVRTNSFSACKVVS
jgi:hypothetical protein